MPAAMTEGALPKRSTALLLVMVLGLLALRLGSVPLVGPDEPRYARVAVEAQRAGAWVTPTLQGRPWLEKPPLYYWLAGAGYRLLGERESAARWPSVLAATLLCGLTALVGARLMGAPAGLHAGFVLGSSLLFFAYGRSASMDMLLAACVSASIGLLALRLVGSAGRLAVHAAWAFAGLACLAKGPLGLLLPILVLVAYAAARRSLEPLREAFSWPGLLLFAAVAGPWYVAVTLANGQAFIDTFLLDHNVSRFTSTVHNHPGSPLYYVPVLLAGLFPWTGLALPALAGARPRTSARDAFLLCWLLAPLTFFSAAGSKLPGYVLPCLPPLALLCGRAAADWVQGDRLLRRAAALLGVVVAAAVAALPGVVRFQIEDPAWASTLPLAGFAVLTALIVSRRVGSNPAGALQALRVGAAGFLMLLTSVAPGILARHQSGRDLFLPANRREVLAWGAWRTAWMAGYFYNDGKVREVSTLAEVSAAAAAGPVLVLCGPGERGRLEAALHTKLLAEGPRGHVLVSARAAP
jgi:4-amino-4-deoxy-L-arabinose transferase-like glycosyltransferase